MATLNVKYKYENFVHTGMWKCVLQYSDSQGIITNYNQNGSQLPTKAEAKAEAEQAFLDSYVVASEEEGQVEVGS